MSYIKLDRKLLDWEWFKDPTTTHLWLYILLKANHKEKMWHGIVVEPGNFITSEFTMSAETGLSRQQIRSSLKKLITTNEITKHSTKTYTQITVMKWAEYQGNGEKATNRTTNKPTIKPTTTKEIEEVKEDKNKYLEEKSAEFITAFEDFKQMRIKKKKPMTDKAIARLLKKLNGFGDEKTQIKILEKSTDYCWTDVYPLDEKKQKEDLNPKRYEVPW